MAQPERAPADLHPFLTSKRFSTSLRTSGGSIVVEVVTPDLTEAPTSVWGDWGPMYTCELSPEQKVRVVYRSGATDQRAEYVFSPPSIAVHSPELFERRLRHPLYLEVVDAGRGLRVRAFMDKSGKVKEVETRSLYFGLDVGALAFRDAEASVHELVQAPKGSLDSAA